MLLLVVLHFSTVVVNVFFVHLHNYLPILHLFSNSFVLFGLSISTFSSFSTAFLLFVTDFNVESLLCYCVMISEDIFQ